MTNSSPVLVTAAGAGIPETEQVKIALELILSQGGIAVMQQIYDAVEKRLDDGIYLSVQGKHSLRRAINTRAVEEGYIHSYDGKNPGWRITEDGVDYIRQELEYPIGRIKITARAFVNFQLALKEIRTLLDFYDAARKNLSHRDRSVEIFKKTGIILTVTAWETFIEDILELFVNQKLEDASSPNAMQKAFNTIAQNWYAAILNKQDGHPKPNDFIKWTGSSWKRLIQSKLEEDLASLNTPKSRNIRNLSKRYLGVDITDRWTWPRMSAQKARNQLDELIELRGELAHRIGNYFEAKSNIRRDKLINSVDFIERLAVRTEEILDEL